MSSNVLSRLEILLTADSSQMRQEVRDTADQTESDFDRMLSSGKNLAAGLAGVLSAGMFIDFVASSAAAVSEMDNQAKAVGITAQSYQALGYAAQKYGVESEKMYDAMSGLNEKILDAATGGEDAGNMFKAMGIEVKDTSGQLKSADIVLAEMSDSFGKMADGATKSALASELMGDAGMELLPVLDNGAAGLKAAADEAERLGLILDEKTIAANKQLKADMGLTAQVTQNLGARIAGELSPTLNNLSSQFRDTAASGDVAKGVAGALGGGLKVLASMVAIAGAGFEWAGDKIGWFSSIIISAASGDFAGAWEIVKSGADISAYDAMVNAAERVKGVWKDAPASIASTNDQIERANNALAVTNKLIDLSKDPEKEKKKEKKPEAVLDLGGVMAPMIDPTQQVYDYFSRVSSAVLVGAVQVTDAQAQARGIMQADGTVAWLPRIEPDVIESNQSGLLQIADLHVDTTARTAEAWYSMYEQIKADRFGFDQQLSMSAIQGLEAQREQINQRSMLEKLFYRDVDAEAKARIESDLQREREKLEQKKLLLTQEYNDKMSLIQSAAALELASESETKQAIAVLDQQFADQKRMLRQQELDEHMRTVTMSKDFFVNGLNAMAGSNDKAAKAAQAIAKVTAIQEVITDTPAAAMGAYNAVVGIPFIGPTLAPVAAAAAYAFGALQIRNITSGGKSSASASAPSIPSAPSTPNAPAVPDVKKPEPVTNITLDPDRFFTGRMLVDAIDDVFGDGYVPKNIQFVLGGA